MHPPCEHQGFCLKWPFFIPALLPEAIKSARICVFISGGFVKQVFWFLCAVIVPALIGGSLVSVAAQTSSPTPDPFTAQITNTSAPFNSQMGDISANGRFVVFTSNGDVSTEKLRDGRNNADGNREIFLLDYAQRRIFQITNTQNVPKAAASPSPTPTPTASPSPTPTPSPTPADLTQVQIEVDNRSPMISLTGTVSGGQRFYTIVFSSNAPSPGNPAASPSATDANSEIWIYKLPAVTDVDLTLGAEIPFVDLATGAFTQVTTTTATRAPTPGATNVAPFFADDNRDPAISDDGNILAFISTRTQPGTNNSDSNPELFLYNVAATTFTQATNTQDPTPGIGSVFQASPSLSSDGSVVAFLSSANLAGSNADGNAEIYLGNFSGATFSNVRQVTRTQNNAGNVNVLSTGRRLSRNGALIAFESTATDPKSNAAPAGRILGLWVYTVATDTFTEIGTRPPAPLFDIGRFPMFTDYNASLAPSSLVFASFLNFRPDGTFPAQAQASEGLNTDNSPEIFLTQIPASSSNTFIRLTNMPSFNAAGTRPIASETRKRIAFAVGGEELGGGNGDGSQEIFYLLTPQITATSSAVLSFFTGASAMPVAAATPLPSPTPSPTPTPSPVPGQPIGLAAGELSIVRSTVALAPSDVELSGSDVSSEIRRSPALPIELNGVSVSVRGAAAGLYKVSSTDKQINFVMPIGLPVGVHTVVVNVLDSGANTDTAHRGLVQVLVGQPDIFTFPGGVRAAAVDANTRAPEPFSVNQTIELQLTGVRFAAPAEITITVGTTTISGSQIVRVSPNLNMAGFDFIQFTLPASLAGAGDVPIQVTFARGITTTSRPADTAPRITIN
jgi:WD40-like Beta Propeller Repeat